MLIDSFKFYSHAKNNQMKILSLSLIILYFSLCSTKAQTCNSGELGWSEISNMLTAAGCTGCHGMAGGFSLASYTNFIQGGNNCGSDITQSENFLGAITIDNFNACQGTVNGMSMNDRATNPLDSLELLQIKRWLNAGVPELCENFCLNNEFVQTTLSGALYHFEVDSVLEANNSIASNADITYEAGQRITLYSGFNVDVSSVFHAYIGACE